MKLKVETIRFERIRIEIFEIYQNYSGPKLFFNKFQFDRPVL